MPKHYRVLSLFANIGVAEAYLEELGIEVSVANEIDKRRAKLYSKIYPNTEMICGDITTDQVYNTIITTSREHQVNVVIATPPCQGMSTAGPQSDYDPRNRLSLYAFSAIKDLHPEYALIENVQEYKNTQILINDEPKYLLDVLNEELADLYNISVNYINTADYEVPQSRDRIIILLSKRGTKKIWGLPKSSKHKVTLKEAIGHIPSIDPFVKDLSRDEFVRLFPHFEERKNAALAISKWNIPPVHVYRQVLAMQHTPSGCSAFDNEKFKPTKADGTPVKGYHNTYSRQSWDAPAYTVTMDNRKISSQGNVHPGRFLGTDQDGYSLYSDARTLTLYELMLVMSIPEYWPIPDGTEEAFLRRIIGEGIPPLFIKKLFMQII